MGARCRLGFLAGSALIASLRLGAGEALAQTEEYFSAPATGSPTNAKGVAQNGTTPTESGDNARVYSGLYARMVAQSNPDVSPWTIWGYAGLDEIATDNVADSASNRTTDLGSVFSAGIRATADTPRLYGVFSGTGVYRRQIDDTSQDRFGGFGYASGHAAIIPDTLYFYARGYADNVTREGGGLQNALAQTTLDTQTFTLSGSPILYTPVDRTGVNVLRYEIAQAWFDHNTGPIQVQGLNVGPISDATNQVAREDFKVPGTVLPRLWTDVSLSASENDSGPQGSGDFVRDRGELINEYEVTRSASILGGAGYERLHDGAYPNVDGNGPVWDIGARLRPNADSYALLTYGRHDLKTDFTGELVWNLTPRTNIYAAYTDSITNGQNTIIASNDASELGPTGTLTHVSFDESTVVGTLDDKILNVLPDAGRSESFYGIPLFDFNNALPLENGLFRDKAFRATGHTVFRNRLLTLTILRLDRTQLTKVEHFFGQIGRVETSTGAILSSTTEIAQDLSGLAGLRYEHVDLGADNALPLNTSRVSDHYGATLSLTWALSSSLTGIIRYDLTYNETHPSTNSTYVNTLTIGLHKTLD